MFVAFEKNKKKVQQTFESSPSIWKRKTKTIYKLSECQTVPDVIKYLKQKKLIEKNNLMCISRSLVYLYSVFFIRGILDLWLVFVFFFNCQFNNDFYISKFMS